MATDLVEEFHHFFSKTETYIPGLIAVKEAIHAANSYVVQVSAWVQESRQTLYGSASVKKNGYAYIYFSNESNDLVFFDNFNLTHQAGPLLEETHYYPFGLTMGGISSKAAGSLKSNKGFNGNELQSKEFSDGNGLELYDFNARTYDQQIGRFMQIDPETELWQESLSPYHFGLNNPILHDDPDGKNPIVLYRALRIPAKIIEWSIKDARAVPASMALKNLSDNASVIKPLMDLKTLKEVNDVIVVNAESITEARSENPKGGTYVLKDDDGKVQRSGRTNDLKRREGEHAKNENTKDLKFQVDKKTDNKDAQRGREQEIHEKHNPPMNKIKLISDKNPNKQKYLDAAKELEKPKTNNP